MKPQIPLKKDIIVLFKTFLSCQHSRNTCSWQKHSIKNSTTHCAGLTGLPQALSGLVECSQTHEPEAAARCVSSPALSCLTRWGTHAVTSYRGLRAPPWAAPGTSGRTRCCTSPQYHCDRGVLVLLCPCVAPHISDWGAASSILLLLFFLCCCELHGDTAQTSDWPAFDYI